LWASGTGTGNLEISNLPFTASSTLNSYQSCAIGYVRDVTFSGTLTAYIETSGAYIVFRENLSASAGGNLAYDSAGRIMVSGSYRTA
jgi:predicted pyridoxine 5'-phosphate oxidase superfamily flavin-nucleotide-binding protein